MNMNPRSFTAWQYSVGICIVFSVVLLCSCNHGLVAAADDLTWTEPAAEEAENAASYHCSGHGFVFTDTLGFSQTTNATCECNTCFGGKDCSVLSIGCTAISTNGDPPFMEKFWIKNKERSATVVPGWYRTTYQISDQVDNVVTPKLESLIKKLHALVGNAVTENRYLVAGVGSTQLINAAVHSLSYSSSGYRNRAIVVAPVPYYDVYKTQTELFESTRYVWAGDSRQFANKTLNSTIKYIELVASPNNPDGVMQEGVLDKNLGNVKVVIDRAYYWPHYSAIKEPADGDVVLFTLSKFTGHAGSRFGWALVKDSAVYQRMKEYVDQNVVRVSHDTLVRSANLLRVVIQGYEERKARNTIEDRIFDYAYGVMSSRWKKLQQAFKGSQRFSLQQLNSTYCNFFNREHLPSPPYAWVKCLKDADCGAVFQTEADILGKNGTIYGADRSYVRFNLMSRDDAFEILLSHLHRVLPRSRF